MTFGQMRNYQGSFSPRLGLEVEGLAILSNGIRELLCDWRQIECDHGIVSIELSSIDLDCGTGREGLSRNESQNEK